MCHNNFCISQYLMRNDELDWLITWDDPLVIPLNSAKNVHFGAIYPFIDPNLAFYTLFEAQCPSSLSREYKTVCTNFAVFQEKAHFF